MGHKTIFHIFLEILKNEFCVYYRHVPKKNFRKECHMHPLFSIMTLLLIEAAAITTLYKVTFPTCTARRCNHTHSSAA